MMNANAANFDPGHPRGYETYTPSSYYEPNNQHHGVYPAGGDAAAGGAYDVMYDSPGGLGPAVYYDPHDHPHAAGAYGDVLQQQPPQASQQSPPDAAAAMMGAAPGYYFPVQPLLPQWGDAPVTALAYDDVHAAMYVASATQNLSSSRPSRVFNPWATAQRRHNSIRFDRAAMLATHSTTEGMNGLLYASCAGHPEAPTDALMAVYRSMYGLSGTTTTSSTATTTGAALSSSSSAATAGRNNVPHIPSHAYRPVYGRTNGSTPGMDLPTAMMGGLFEAGKGTFHMGINTLLPLSGYVASVSPSAVRIHAHGGLQLADQDVEGMICGTANPLQDPRGITHVTVGGVVYSSNNPLQAQKKQHLHCLDLWQGLRIVTSRTFYGNGNHTTEDAAAIGVTAMATSHTRGSIVAGCSDGQLRFLDGSLREVARIKSHTGGVTNVAVSDDGTLIATAGYGYRPTQSNSLYAFPDPNVLLYDIRFLGRGGIPHPIAALNGGPRYLSFIPSVTEEQPANRLLVASGQVGGGIQIIVPFEPSQNDNPANIFLLPQLNRGESISAMCVSEDDLALGTSQCRVLQYKMAGYDSSLHHPYTEASNSGATSLSPGREFVPMNARSQATSAVSGSSVPPNETNATPVRQNQPLEMPSFAAPLPPLSLEPSILQSDNPNVRNGINDAIKSIFTAYVMAGEPTLSSLGSETATRTFGPLTNEVLLPSSKKTISSDLANHSIAASDGDYLMTIPTSSLNMELMENHADSSRRDNTSCNVLGHSDKPLPNPNKLLYSPKMSSLCYDESLNRARPISDSKQSRNRSESLFQDENNNDDIPLRYRLTLRPTFKSGSTFDYAEFNSTGIFPGWDYPPTMPNSFASPVLMLLYFNPKLRSATLAAQFQVKKLPSRSPLIDKHLAPELGFLFHQMESISRIALSYPTSSPYQGARLRAWVPTNFLASLSAMTEAEQLQILDGSPSAVDLPRRPEAFYRFLLYRLDKELSEISETNLVDSLHGTDFMSVNEFITGSGQTSKASNRALTVELAYDSFRGDPEAVRFGQVLQRALCRETRLRAWNESSRSYETIVQRKIATSLPQILSLSCACAGRKEADGLKMWRIASNDKGHWLPEFVEVELSDDGGVIVKEPVQNGKGNVKQEWDTFRIEASLPASVSQLVLKEREASSPPKSTHFVYRLDAVVSFVRDDPDTSPVDSLSGTPGHHVLHVRVPRMFKKELLSLQHKEVLSLAETDWSSSKMFPGDKNWDESVYRQRASLVERALAKIDGDVEAPGDDDWIIANGFAVSETVVEDARAFHVPFKEPCLLVFTAIGPENPDSSREAQDLPSNLSVPTEVLDTRSITNGKPPAYPVLESNSLPGKGDLVAFDAEFVSVQEEESTLTKNGSKRTLREVRHAVARISVIDCRTRKVLIDDHVLPKEPVVDYLTRFSGIVARDLDPHLSPHHLISTRSAYMKLRLLMERGCIFVGHGLCQDFLMVNLVVPNQQIIDTVEIFHQERMRYISLRFLANYVLGRDMQQDTHDSVEDALAAYELYLKAVELKKSNQFEKLLGDLYEYGRKTEWKLGVEAGE